MPDKTVDLDFAGISDQAKLHETLARVFGFPDFYGRNIHALIDCLSSLRFPEDQLTSVVLGPSETLVMRIKNAFSPPPDLLHDFLVAIGSVNTRYEQRQQPPVISLILYD